MGLESLELIVSVEEVFGIEISDQEACDITTVKDMVDCISRKLRCKTVKSKHRVEIESLFIEHSKSIHVSNYHMDLPIRFQVSKDEFSTIWSSISSVHKTPKTIDKTDFNFKKYKQKSLLDLSPNQLIDWLVCLNCIKKIKKNPISSIEDIQYLLSKILMTSLKIPFFKIEPHADLSKDLGID